jgi:hypothetical protein
MQEGQKRRRVEGSLGLLRVWKPRVFPEEFGEVA